MKLRMKLMNEGHEFFKPVNPEKVRRALALLKQGNHFYSDFKIENVISLVILMKTLKLLITHKDKKVIDFTVEAEDCDYNENENRNPVH